MRKCSFSAFNEESCSISIFLLIKLLTVNERSKEFFVFNLFSVNYYKELQNNISAIGSKYGNDGVQYAKRINDAISAAMKATQLGDLRATAESLRMVVAMTTTWVDTVKKNPILFYILNFFAPDEIERLVNAMDQHKAGAAEANELMGVFSRMLFTAGLKHSFEGVLTMNGRPVYDSR